MGVYLSKPKTKKDNGNGETTGLRFAYSSMQGWRTSMEDAHIATPNIKDGVHLFAVFDGHGGAEVAKFCELRFGEQLRKNKNFAEGRYRQALEETFLKMDEMLSSAEGERELRGLKQENEGRSFAGCTANVCLITPTEIICANAGDSRAVVSCPDGVVALSEDHKPDLPNELARIRAAGGYVSAGRVNDNLNLSRAIGDLEFKRNSALLPSQQIISAFPEVTIFPLSRRPRFLLMGCDGIWETLSSKAICDSIAPKVNKTHKLSNILDDLLDRLLAKTTSSGQGCDNMTSILVHFIDPLPTGKA